MNESQTITRRNVFRGLPLAAMAYSIPAMATAADAQLIQFGRDLASAWADEDAVYAADTLDDEAADAATERTSAIVQRIKDCPAYTLDGLRVKARAIAWCHSGNVDLVGDGAGTDMQMAQGIIADLLRAA